MGVTNRMKIAIVTSGFDSVNPGGVSNVVLKVVAALNKLHEVEILSFANEKNDLNSIQLFKPKTYFNLNQSKDLHENVPIWRFGAVFSEFEFLRYRKRRELKNFFTKYELILVITGFLQFANLIPKVDIPVYVQCATRLKWERISQYSGMPLVKRLVLRAQLPFLAFQEFRVIHSRMILLPENVVMRDWLKTRTKQEPLIWYPGTSSPSDYVERKAHNFVNAPYISIGRFGDKRKGWERLILSYKKAFDQNGNLPELILVGWGQFDDLVESNLFEVQQHYPIRVFPNLSNTERNNLLRNSSIFLQASFEEGLGLAAVEAISFGLPVLASETNGSLEYVAMGVNGYRVPQGVGFIKDFTNAILSTTAWNLEEMSRKSREIFEEKFEKKISEEKLLKILEIY